MKLDYTVHIPEKKETQNKEKVLSPETTMSMQQVVNQALSTRIPTGGSQQAPQTSTSKGYGRTQ